MRNPETLWRGAVEIQEGRTFINSSIGCASRCVYCYLPELGYGVGMRPKEVEISGSTLVEHLKSEEDFVIGKHGSILSFGCFSEPFDPHFIDKTIEFIRHLAPLKNPMQVATKRFVSREQAAQIAGLLDYPNQLTVHIGLTTFDRWREIEKGTDSPQRRLQALAHFQEVDIPACLTIKPVLPGITDREINKFVQAIKEFNISQCVVGILYIDERIKNELQAVGATSPSFKKPFFEQEGLHTLPFDDEEIVKEAPSRNIIDKIIKELHETGIPVFRTTTCAVAYNAKISNPTKVWEIAPDLCVKLEESEYELLTNTICQNCFAQITGEDVTDKADHAGGGLGWHLGYF